MPAPSWDEMVNASRARDSAREALRRMACAYAAAPPGSIPQAGEALEQAAVIYVRSAERFIKLGRAAKREADARLRRGEPSLKTGS